MTSPVPEPRSVPARSGRVWAARVGELKFLLDATTATRVESWARERLEAAGPEALEGAHLHATLYLDTPDLDVAWKSKGFRKVHYRLRRRVGEDVVHLERKERRRDRVRRETVVLRPEEVGTLREASVAPSWSGHRFHAEMRSLDLGPACRVSFRRSAFRDAEGLCRMTLDRGIVGIPTRSWELSPVEGGTTLLGDGALLEIDFDEALPPHFLRLVSSLGLVPGRFSKYRRLMRACGALSARSDDA